MAKKRLLNCEFVNASSFKINLSNKAKLLYLMMFVNADDKGFVDTCDEIIKSLNENDNTFRNEINMSLLSNNYESALNELLDKGMLYLFTNNHQDKIYLIRHWYFHNKLVKGLWTNYGKFVKLVKIEDDEYHLKTKEELLKPFKESKLKESNINNDTDTDMVLNDLPKQSEPTEQELEKMSREELEKYLP